MIDRHNDADELVATAKVILVVGPGGVGKTTLSASMAARAAAVHGRRALVVTVDPARRLADALGLEEFGHDPVLVPVGEGPGRLWAQMIDMEQSWDRLVNRHSPDLDTARALLDNRLYRTLTQRFVQSHDYIALDHLVDLAERDEFDVVVIDTPPSVHALDVLDAPERMLEFFGSRLLRWLTAPYRSRVVRVGAKPFLAVAERLLGGPFLQEIADFFWLFSMLQPDFVERAYAINDRLSDSETRYVVVQTTRPGPSEQATSLVAELVDRGHEPSLRLVNRVLDPQIRSLDDELDTVDDADLRRVLAGVVSDAMAQADLTDRMGVQRVPWSPRPVGDVAGLIALLDGDDSDSMLDG